MIFVHLHFLFNNLGNQTYIYIHTTTPLKMPNKTTLIYNELVNPLKINPKNLNIHTYRKKEAWKKVT